MPSAIRRLVLPFTLLLLAGAFACDGSPSPGTTGDVPRDDELVVLLEAPPKTLDPVFATDAYGVRISHELIFETLTRLNDDLVVEPHLAQRIERLSPTRYRFTLRGGVRFADGSPLEAADAVYSLRTVMDPNLGSPYGPVLRDKVAALRETGALTFEIDLRRPYASFLGDLILPVRSRRAGPQRPLLGSGPYRLAARHVGEIVLERNPVFHGPPAGVKRLVFKVVRDENTRLLKFRKGAVDLAINVVPLTKVARFRRRPLEARYRIEEAPGLAYTYLGFNLEHPVLRQVDVRRAIARAIDVATLIRHRQGGHSVPAVSLMPPGSPFLAPGLEPIPHDPAAAARLLDAAGFPARDGVRFHLIYKTSTDRAAVFQARVIQQHLRRVGIAVEVRSYEWGTFYDDIQKGNFELFSLRWIGVSDPDFYYELFHSSRMPPEGRNRVRYRDPEMDRLLEGGRVEGDPSRRRAIYQRVQEKLAADLPYLSLWHSNNIAVVARRVRGFRLHPSGGFQHLPGARVAVGASGGARP